MASGSSGRPRGRWTSSASARRPRTSAGCQCRARLVEKDFLEYGFTMGCPGCRHMQHGLPHAPHTPACRARMEGMLATGAAGQERLQRAQERSDSFLAEAVGRADARG
eukprot:8185300-Lingulodinium_polyedra.AAC.1